MNEILITASLLLAINVDMYAMRQLTSKRDQPEQALNFTLI